MNSSQPEQDSEFQAIREQSETWSQKQKQRQRAGVELSSSIYLALRILGLNAHQNKDGFLNFVILQDYELQLASYTSGLETLLNIPIKRTMVQSPSGVILQEVYKSLHIS